MLAWEELVRLAEKHSRRLAANLYRASLLSMEEDGDDLRVEIGLAQGSFELRQIQAPGTCEEISEHLGRALGRRLKLKVTPLAQEPVVAPAPGGASPEPKGPAPVGAQAPAIPSQLPRPVEPPRETSEGPHSLRERDEAWKREDRARKRQEALAHAAVRDAVEVLEGTVQDIHVLVD